jgi:flagellar assembly protein FliH
VTTLDRVDAANRAVSFEAPAFTVAQSLRDPQREAAELAKRRRDRGYEEGYQRGWATAESDVEAAIGDHRHSAERLARCAVALERAIDDLARRETLALAEIEPDVVALAVALAAEILGHELSTVDEPVLDALARVANLLPDRGTPTLRVHPDDAETAREAVAADVVRWTRDVEFVADPAVERGGCIVDVGPCRIDGQIGTAVARMRDALQ